MTLPKIAMFVPPHTGGIFTFYRRMAEALGDCVCSVELDTDAAKWRDYAPELAGPEHQIISLGGRSGKDASQHIAKWILSNDISTIILIPLSPTEVFDALPHLPAHIRVLVRLTEISSHNYKLALRQADHIDGIIVQCPRQKQDLEGLAPDCPKHLLPNGTDTNLFLPGTSTYTPQAPLRILVVDRLVDSHKRILLLPKLCTHLKNHNVQYELTIAGDGPDREKLQKSLNLKGHKTNVKMLGRVLPKDIPRLMANHHVYLKLSLNEGSPNAVLEAMSAGLATVAMDIPGVMDFVISDDKTGKLIISKKIGDMARIISQLSRDPDHLAALRKNARISIVENFSMDVFERRLKTLLLDHVHVERRSPKSWNLWTTPPSQKVSILRGAAHKIPLKWRIIIREKIQRRRGA